MPHYKALKIYFSLPSFEPNWIGTSLSIESCRDANCVVTGGAGGCLYDNWRCTQWRHIWHHDDSRCPELWRFTRHMLLWFFLKNNSDYMYHEFVCNRIAYLTLTYSYLCHTLKWFFRRKYVSLQRGKELFKGDFDTLFFKWFLPNIYACICNILWLFDGSAPSWNPASVRRGSNRQSIKYHGWYWLDDACSLSIMRHNIDLMYFSLDQRWPLLLRKLTCDLLNAHWFSMGV